MADRKELNVGGTIVSIDLSATATLNENNGLYQGCQCEGCTNKRLARYRFAPAEQHRLIEDLGLEPTEPFLDNGLRWRRGTKKPGWYRLESFWLLSGHIVDRDQTPSIFFDPENSWRIQTDVPAIDLIERRMSDAGLESAFPLLFLVFKNAIPYLYKQVSEFRSIEQGRRCLSCEGWSSWVETGYLKKHSRIPEWYGLPDLTNLAHRKRVFVAICHDCGHLSWKLVDGSPYRGSGSPDHDFTDSNGRRFVILDGAHGWTHEPWKAKRAD